MKIDRGKLKRYIARNKHTFRFLWMTAFAVVFFLIVFLGVTKIINELAIPNRPLIAVKVATAIQEGNIEDGKPIFGETTYFPVVIKNIGRKPATKISWIFTVGNAPPNKGLSDKPLSRSDSLVVLVENFENPAELWEFTLFKSNIEYTAPDKTVYFSYDSFLVAPLLSDWDKRRMAGLAPGQITEKKQ